MVQRRRLCCHPTHLAGDVVGAGEAAQEHAHRHRTIEREVIGAIADAARGVLGDFLRQVAVGENAPAQLLDRRQVGDLDRLGNTLLVGRDGIRHLVDERRTKRGPLGSFRGRCRSRRALGARVALELRRRHLCRQRARELAAGCLEFTGLELACLERGGQRRWLRDAPGPCRRRLRRAGIGARDRYDRGSGRRLHSGSSRGF
jgi:hypothetical protein